MDSWNMMRKGDVDAIKKSANDEEVKPFEQNVIWMPEKII